MCAGWLRSPASTSCELFVVPWPGQRPQRGRKSRGRHANELRGFCDGSMCNHLPVARSWCAVRTSTPSREHSSAWRDYTTHVDGSTRSRVRSGAEAVWMRPPCAAPRA
eukprot:1764799-Prymnesium_polylepis.2